MRGVEDAWRVQASGEGELSSCRVIKLCACEVSAVRTVILSRSQQDSPVAQYGYRLTRSSGIQASRQRECAGRGVVQLRARDVVCDKIVRWSSRVEHTSRNQDL